MQKKNQEMKTSEKPMSLTEQIITRPPVVVVLGHIDHGKTSLLNAIRQIQFTGEKPGGAITQHIGAYQVVKNGKEITFIDTPGHEAFSQMRSRGAKVADIAVLVVAADEGIKIQTKEAILHIKKAGLPLIAALNKIDKPGANPEKAKRELEKEGVLVEGLGGKVPAVEISAKTGQGISELLELILLVAEMQGFKAALSKSAEAVIIESYMDSQRGPTATLILSQGILRPGDIVATVSTVGKIKTLEDFQNKKVAKVLPSQPAVVIGFEKAPKIGETVKAFPDLEAAQKYLRQEKTSRAQVFEIKPDQKVLNLVVKTDVLGSAEAIEGVLKNLPQDKIVLRILKSEVGDINENDIDLAKSGRGIILGFRVGINPIAKNIVRTERVRIMNFEIIYDLVEEVRKAMERTLETEKVRTDLGKVKVLIAFWSEKNRQIVGGRLIEGQAKRGTLIEVLRKDEFIGRGKMVNLQKNKKDVEKAGKGEEVGILYEGGGKIEVGDILVLYQEERKRGEL